MQELQDRSRSSRHCAAYQAEEELFRFFRLYAQDENVQRVEKLLSLFVEAERLRVEIFGRATEQIMKLGSFEEQLASMVTQPRLEFLHFENPFLETLNREYVALHQQIEQSLRRYKWTPTIAEFRYRGMSVAFDFLTSDKWEDSAVDFLLKQIDGHDNRAADIANFRKCKLCSRWFYALTNHQLFCGEICRKKYASQAPEFKRQRREYMRNTFRPREKAALADSLSSVKGRKKLQNDPTRRS